MTHSINDKARKKKLGHGLNVSKRANLETKCKIYPYQSSITVEIVCDHKSFVSFKKKKLKIFSLMWLIIVKTRKNQYLFKIFCTLFSRWC